MILQAKKEIKKAIFSRTTISFNKRSTLVRHGKNQCLNKFLTNYMLKLINSIIYRVVLKKLLKVRVVALKIRKKPFVTMDRRVEICKF